MAPMLFDAAVEAVKERTRGESGAVPAVTVDLRGPAPREGGLSRRVLPPFGVVRGLSFVLLRVVGVRDQVFAFVVFLIRFRIASPSVSTISVPDRSALCVNVRNGGGKE